MNNGIENIEYNVLNLPKLITFANGGTIRYTYSATGEKLRAEYTMTSDSIIKTTDYCGNLIYEQGRPKMLLVDGGYVTFNDNANGNVCDSLQWHYYLTDHLGNNRVVVNSNDSIEQVNHYYPYGGLMAESTGGDTQRYKYNGKELDRMHGLDWYDYGARWMNPVLGRFTTPDPKQWDYTDVSPYVYCLNNPMNAVDPDGKKVRPIRYTEKSTTYYHSTRNFQRAMKAFGRTSFGHQLLSDFTPKGQMIFGVKGNGKYADYNLNLHEFDYSKQQDQSAKLFVSDEGIVNAQTQFNINDGEPQFDIIFDVQRSESDLIETITHEFTIHLSNYSFLLDSYQKTGNIQSIKQMWNSESSSKQHRDIIDAHGGKLEGTRNYNKTSKELIKMSPNLKATFDKMYREYEKHYK